MEFLENVTQSFFAGAATSLASALLLLVATKGVQSLSGRLSLDRDFDLKGYWVGRCWLPSYGGDEAIEIWRYWRTGPKVRFVFFAYENARDKPLRCVGRGIIRNGTFSAFYYEPRTASYESGALILRFKGMRLNGAYAQFDVKGEHEELYVGKDYQQHRLSLTAMQKLKMFFGAPPVPTHDAARSLLMSVQPNTGTDQLAGQSKPI
jgi:hypothetical protein